MVEFAKNVEEQIISLSPYEYFKDGSLRPKTPLEDWAELYKVPLPDAFDPAKTQAVLDKYGKQLKEFKEELAGHKAKYPDSKAYRDPLEACKKRLDVVMEKDTNPKDAISTDKLPLGLVPESLVVYASLAFLEGMLKYGKVNWREAGVRASVYIDAAKRHLGKYNDGEWCDPETQVPHLANVIACCGIILDCQLVGKLKDDRPKQAPVGGLMASLSKTVSHLRNLFKDKSPKHYLHESTALAVEEVK